MDLDHDVILPQLRFRALAEPEGAAFLVAIDQECFHEGELSFLR
jgi:hypothetical protein